VNEHPTCFVCGDDASEKYIGDDEKPTCWKHCSSGGDGLHERDPRSIALADGTNYRDGQLLFDISCARCGQSGSFVMAVPTDSSGGIDWA
jgi:hypothetical protein